jgi:lambda family phage portal protein
MTWRFWKRDSVGSAGRRGWLSGFSLRGFQAAKTDRLLAQWTWDGGFTAQEIYGQLATIRARSRDMAKNSPHYKRWLDLLSTNIVGEGFRLKSTPHDGLPGNARLDKSAAQFIEYHWWRFCNLRDPQTRRTYCDASGRKTMAQMDRCNIQTWARDGEYFVEVVRTADNPYGITFRIIRPDACDEKYHTPGVPADGHPMVHCGVERDKGTLRPLAYYIRTVPGMADLTGPTGPLKRVPAERIIHGFRAYDEDQPRGVPWAHSALIKMKMLDEYDRAELTAARDEACSVRSYKATQDANPNEFADLTKEENSATANSLLMEKEPGQAEILPTGYEMQIHTPQHPNREVTAFKASMLKDAASGLGVEYSNFANDWSGVSFSSVRVGTISERDLRIVDQDDYIANCKSPMFLFWLDSFLRLDVSGELPIAKFDKFAEHEFRGRRWMWVDPMKDMEAAQVAVQRGWKTNTQVASDLGTDFEDNIEVLREEQQRSRGVVTGSFGQQPATTAKTQKEGDNDEDKNATEK